MPRKQKRFLVILLAWRGGAFDLRSFEECGEAEEIRFLSAVVVVDVFDAIKGSVTDLISG
jgi:hypothetical protein